MNSLVGAAESLRRSQLGGSTLPARRVRTAAKTPKGVRPSYAAKERMVGERARRPPYGGVAFCGRGERRRGTQLSNLPYYAVTGVKAQAFVLCLFERTTPSPELIEWFQWVVSRTNCSDQPEDLMVQNN